MKKNSVSGLVDLTSDNPPVPVISVRDLDFSWSRTGSSLLAIPKLEIAAGERIFLYGPSGSGKTTLLNLLSGVTSVRSGELHVLGQNFMQISQRQRDKFRARNIGVIFQQFNLIPYLSLLDNVLLGAHFAGFEPEPCRDRARYLLTALGLDITLFQQPARYLSVGQQQRVAVARALVTQPKILIADEPSSALDSDSRDAFMKLLINSATEAGCTIIFVSHDKNLQGYFSRAIDIRDLQDKNYSESAHQQAAAC